MAGTRKLWLSPLWATVHFLACFSIKRTVFFLYLLCRRYEWSRNRFCGIWSRSTWNLGQRYIFATKSARWLSALDVSSWALLHKGIKLFCLELGSLNLHLGVLLSQRRKAMHLQMLLHWIPIKAPRGRHHTAAPVSQSAPDLRSSTVKSLTDSLRLHTVGRWLRRGVLQVDWEACPGNGEGENPAEADPNANWKII